MNKEYTLRVTTGDNEHRTTVVNLRIDGQTYLNQYADMLTVLKFSKDSKSDYCLNGDYTVTFDGGEFRHYTCEDTDGKWMQVTDVLLIGYTRTKITKYIEF